jgi:hypothetical protein
MATDPQRRTRANDKETDPVTTKAEARKIAKPKQG